MTDEQIAHALQSFTESGILTAGTAAVRASRDPDDDKFLAAAVEAKAQYLVTGDKDLLALKAYRRVRIITPRSFLRILEAKQKTRSK